MLTRSGVVPVIGLAVIVLALVAWITWLHSDLRGLQSEVRSLREGLNSTRKQTDAIVGLLPNVSWKPGIEDLRIVDGPLFTATPVQDPPRPEWEWRIGSQFEVENGFREDLVVLFEIEFVCEPEVCVYTYQPYKRREYEDGGGVGSRYRDGWRRLWDFDDVPQRNVLLIPTGGHITIDFLGADLVTSSKVFPEAEYTIRGTARLVHDGLHYTFTWTLAEGVLNQSELADSEAPYVVSTEPRKLAANVPVNTSIAIKFSEPVDKESAGAATIVSPFVGGSSAWNSERTEMTFEPEEPLLHGTRYDVTILSSLRDDAGNEMTSPYSFTFNTQEAELSIEILGADHISPNVTRANGLWLTTQNHGHRDFNRALVTVTVPARIHLDMDGVQLAESNGKWIYSFVTDFKSQASSKYFFDYQAEVYESDFDEDMEYNFRILVKVYHDEVLLGREEATWTVVSGPVVQTIQWETFLWEDGAYRTTQYRNVVALDLADDESVLWMLASRTADSSIKAVKVDLLSNTLQAYSLPFTPQGRPLIRVVEGNPWVIDTAKEEHQVDNESVWVLTDSWTRVPLTMPGFTSLEATDICGDPSGSVWISGTGILGGSQSGWVTRIDDYSQDSLYTTFPTDKGNKTFRTINTMVATPKELWLGSDEGLLSYDPREDEWIYDRLKVGCGGNFWECYVSRFASPSAAAMSVEGDRILFAGKANHTAFHDKYSYAKVGEYIPETREENILFLWEQIGGDIYETVSVCGHSNTIWLLEVPSLTQSPRLSPWLVRYTVDRVLWNSSTFHRFLPYPSFDWKVRPTFNSMVGDSSGTLYLSSSDNGLIMIGSDRAKEKEERFWRFQSYSFPLGEAELGHFLWKNLFTHKGVQNETHTYPLTISPRHQGAIDFDAYGDHPLRFSIRLLYPNGTTKYEEVLTSSSPTITWTMIGPGTYNISIDSSSVSFFSWMVRAKEGVLNPSLQTSEPRIILLTLILALLQMVEYASKKR